MTGSATITLAAGKKYAIGVEMYDHLDEGVIKLEWQSASEPRDVVPASRLFVPAPPVPPLKVMAVGDSLTASSGGHASWRYWFAKQMEYGGHQFDMIGRNLGVSGGASLYGSFDRAKGVCRDAADEILAQVSTYAGAAPDVVLLEAGLFDVLAGQANAQTVGELGAIIDVLRGLNPVVKIALAQLPPVAGKQAEIAALNALIAGLAAEKNSESSPVVVANLSDGYGVAGDTEDGVNPNTGGGRRSANVSSTRSRCCWGASG